MRVIAQNLPPESTLVDKVFSLSSGNLCFAYCLRKKKRKKEVGISATAKRHHNFDLYN